MRFHLRRFIPLIAVTFCAMSPVAAQKQLREITTSANAKPSFRIEPIVQRLTGRRGQTLEFQFEMASLNDSTNIEIQPVALTQNENGAIVPDTDSEPPTNLQLFSPSKLELAEDAAVLLRGAVKVPTVESPFHSFGLLVTDHGRTVSSSAPDDQQTSVGITFITRYLLRVDITVPNVRSPNIAKLIIDNAELIEDFGLPVVRAWVVNPTDAPLVFTMQALFDTEFGPLPENAFALLQPVRRNLKPNEREEIRILPHARIRVDETIPFPLFPGNYQLIAQIHERRRTIVQSTFPITIGPRDFPGLETAFRLIAENVVASPGTLELSFLRGGNRYLPYNVSNKSGEEIVVESRAVSLGGEPIDWLLTRPDRLAIRSGQSRKFLVTGDASVRKIEQPKYGAIEVQAKRADGTLLGTNRILVAQLPDKQVLPKLEIGNLTWSETATATPMIGIPVKNVGSVHIPLQGRLRLMDDRGLRFQFVAGYGRWLLPGQEDMLKFRIKDEIPPAEYGLAFQVDQGPDAPTLQGQTRVQISAKPVSDNNVSRADKPVVP